MVADTMAQFGRFYVPPPSAVINVVRETAKSLIPEDSPCLELLRKMTGTDVEQQDRRPSGQPRRMPSGHAGVFESSTSYDEIEGENRMDRMNSLDEQSYQRSAPHKFSMTPGSFDMDESGEGVGEFKSRHRINEWQAAWNVTNAIQVRTTPPQLWRELTR